MKIELTEKEIALISFILSTCKVIMGESNGQEVNDLISKLNSENII